MHSHYKCNYSALVHITLISMGSFVPVQKKGQKINILLLLSKLFAQLSFMVFINKNSC